MLKNEPESRARELYERVVDHERGTQRPLPGSLAERLRAIPGFELERATEPLDCSDLEDRLATSDLGFGDPAIEHHLESCPECQRLYGSAHELATGPASPLPPALRRSLLAIPSQEGTAPDATALGSERREASRRRPRRSPLVRGRLSAWIHDARYAAMACYLLTAGVMWAAGDLPAHFQSARKVAGEQATAWVESSRSGGGELTDAVGTGLVQGVGQGREWLRQGGAAWSRFVERTEDRLRTFPPENLDGDAGPTTDSSTHNENEPSSAPDPSDQGERDGTSR